ncbi:MAG: hypothetical protein CMH32_07730 [Micavibrio sp.]|nr:hypothetical protein [Micavibrio sp.]HCK31950.1 hypothetical protein [Rhodospirillaceae bacterium]|tara:strand:+ start:1279 stop:1536 length:258 start_codon:yes stop_codon:yes gene_type:complete
MEKEIGDKLCSFYIDDDGEPCVAITFPRAKIFKPQADGSIQVFQGPRTINHTALSLRALIESCKSPGDLPQIENALQDYIKTHQL